MSESNWIAAWVYCVDIQRGKTDTSVFGHQDSGTGWYVEMRDAETKETRAIPMKFGRKIDAEKAAATLNAKLPATTIKEGLEKSLKIGLKEFRKLLVEDLAW